MSSGTSLGKKPAEMRPAFVFWLLTESPVLRFVP
jgi:hypothetical protein